MREILGDILAAIADKETRARALGAVILAFAAGMVLMSWLFYDFLASKGCSADAPHPAAMVVVGFMCLGTFALVWFIGGLLLYGGTYLPKVTREWMERRNDPVIRAEQARMKVLMREEFGGLGKRFVMWCKTNWQGLVFIPLIIVASIGFCYLVAYIFWTIYC